MNIDELEKNLSKSLDIFSMEMQGKINNSKGQSLNEYDLDDISRNVFYVMNDFKDSIIKYLKDNK